MTINFTSKYIKADRSGSLSLRLIRKITYLKSPLSFQKKRKNRFSRWRPSWISNRNNFSYFWSTSHPDASYQISRQLDLFSLSVQEKRKIYFQDGRHGDHLGFPIRTILAIFDVQVTLMLPTKFQFNWPFGAKYRFSRWRPSWISDFSYFWSTSHPNASYRVKSQLALRFRSRSEKQIFKMAAERF